MTTPAPSPAPTQAAPTPADPAVTVAELGGSATPLDFSPIGLFLHADLVGQAIIIALVLASVGSWAIIVDKWSRIRRLMARADRFEDSFWSGGNLEQLYERLKSRPGDPLQATFVAGMREWKLAQGPARPGGGISISLQQRVERVMEVTIGREMGLLERNMTFLASVGSVAPFVGLFGTVWGIMRSFSSIAQERNINLAVVAPGISEALFATAIGLAAAIPAVIGYNAFSTDLSRYAERLEAFAAEFATILGRHIDDKVPA